MSNRNAGRIVGALFLSAFLLYGGGSFLVDITTDGAAALPQNAASGGQLSGGALLLLLNSVAVVVIGVLAYGVLRRPHRLTAKLYLVTRTTEAVLLAVAPLGTLTLALLERGSNETSGIDSGVGRLALFAVEHDETTYWLAMTTLGVGSVLFCRAMMRSALLPRFLAVWGMAGYAIFALGGVLELAGYGVGLVLSAPGGLFEVVAACYLLAKGFGGVSGGSVTGCEHLLTPDVGMPAVCASSRSSWV